MFKRYKGIIRKWRYGACYWPLKDMDRLVNSSSDVSNVTLLYQRVCWVEQVW